jgi:hypothetical protein
MSHLSYNSLSSTSTPLANNSEAGISREDSPISASGTSNDVSGSAGYDVTASGRRAKKMTYRELIIEDAKKKQFGGNSSSVSSYNSANKASGSNDERLRVLNMQFLIDAQDREEAIEAFKRKEKELSSSLEQKDKLHRQHEQVINQLSYKLQNVLMEKEEAVERCELLKEQLALMKLKADSK